MAFESGGMAQLHIRLDEEDKEAWREYAEEEGYGSLSRFVRVAVANERSDNSTGGTGNVPDDVATTHDVDQVQDTFLRVVDRLESVEQRLEAVERERTGPRDTQAVVEALPEGRPAGEDLDAGYVKESDPSLERANAGVAVDGRAESVAVVADESPTDVEYFLYQAASRTDEIQVEEIDGEMRYWTVSDVDGGDGGE